MIKLMTMDEFMSHPEFENCVGICSNLNYVYGYNSEVEDAFHEYLDIRRLDDMYPIGRFGYMRANRKERLRKLSDLNRAKIKYVDHTCLYGKTMNCYEGMQGALRHNLYEAFCDWLVKINPTNFTR